VDSLPVGSLKPGLGTWGQFLQHEFVTT
jgi:hypothetical protein